MNYKQVVESILKNEKPKARGISFEQKLENIKWNQQVKLLESLINGEEIDFDYIPKFDFDNMSMEFEIITRKKENNKSENGNDHNYECITLNIDTVSYNEKPTKKDIGLIQKRISENKKQITINEFIKSIEEGKSFKAAALNGNKNIDWESQQVFALDIDNDEASINKYGLLTAQDAYNRFLNLGVPPAFYYESFSSTKERPKFRLVFIVKNAVTDIRIRNAIQMALMNIMPEADAACKDLSRLFFGSNKKSRYYFKEKYLFDPYILVQAMVAWIKERYAENKNAMKYIKTYCERVGLNMINGVPSVQILQEYKNYENSASSIIYNIDNAVNSYKSIIFNFCIDEQLAYKITAEDKGKKNLPKVKINCKKIKYNELIRNFAFDELESNKCKLWIDFINGNRWCYHQEVFGIACNMWRVEGAEQKMINAIKNNVQYNDKHNKIYTIKQCYKYGYEPMKCKNFCPYCNNCLNEGINMLHVIENKRGQIRKLENDGEKVFSLEEGEKKLKEEILNAFNTEEDTITIIKAPPGIGKTEVIKHLNSYNNTVISYPNHRLGLEIFERLCVSDSIHIKELQLENKYVFYEFKRLQQIGAYKQARQYLEQYRNKIIMDKSNIDIAKEKDIKNINQYLLQINECKTTNKLIFCTHRRMLQINNNNIQTFIIDEDIITNTLINTINIKIDDLENLIKVCKNINAFKTKKQLDKLRNKVLSLFNEPYKTVIIPKFEIDTNEIASIINHDKDNLKVNLKDILRIRSVTTNDNREVVGMFLEELPKKRCIILSATANKAVYERVFTDRKVRFIDLDNIETKGDVIVHYTGFSRTKLSRNIDKAIEKIQIEAEGVNNIITFCKYENKFKQRGFNIIAHYGACSGIDSYKGRDLIVAGTPHLDERVYILLASIIQEKLVKNEKIKYNNVKRNGFEFYFNTYEEGSLLQEIQFYYIESELLQAIGRARVLRTDATVHVFSNYPVRGATLYDKKIS